VTDHPTPDTPADADPAPPSASTPDAARTLGPPPPWKPSPVQPLVRIEAHARRRSTDLYDDLRALHEAGVRVYSDMYRTVRMLLGDSFACEFVQIHPDDVAEMIRVRGSIPAERVVIGGETSTFETAVPGTNAWLNAAGEAHVEPVPAESPLLITVGSLVVRRDDAERVLPSPPEVPEQLRRGGDLASAPTRHPTDRPRPTRDDVLSVSGAAAALPWRRGVSFRWLREQGLVVTGPEGRECVRWVDVLDLLGPKPSSAPEPPQKRSGRPRKTPTPVADPWDRLPAADLSRRG
jgi:hypothetical protein